MDIAIQSSDKSVSDVTDLASRHQSLQTEFIKNENRVNSAREASSTANSKAKSANDILYELNVEFKNISTALEIKSNFIGNGKDLAMDLQKRANELATSASNKLASISGMMYSKKSLNKPFCIFAIFQMLKKNLKILRDVYLHYHKN